MHSKKRVVSLILACLITLVGSFSIGGVLATELIEKDTCSQTKDNSKEAVLIDVDENGLEEKEIKMIEMLTVGERFFIPSITVTVIISPKTPPKR